MARYPLPSFSLIWARHEELYANVFFLSLEQLVVTANDSLDEDCISEKLCPVLSQTCFQISKENNIDVPTPSWEKPCQPVVEDELTGGKARKRPDFTCNMVNTFATTAEVYEIPFHVECKRLGTPSSASWVLNKNYVGNGIVRFDSKTHEYGKRATSGMMIGYIVSMELQEILSEVNSFQSDMCPQHPNLHFTFGASKTTKSHQQISRVNVTPVDFKLVHLWADVRISA